MCFGCSERVGAGSARLVFGRGCKVRSQAFEVVPTVFDALPDTVTALTSAFGCAQQFCRSHEAPLSSCYPAFECPDRVSNGVADMKVLLAVFSIAAAAGINDHGVVIRYPEGVSNGRKIVSVEQFSQTAVFS